MRESRLFNRTRIQLTGFYAIAIGLITLLSGLAIHLVLIRAFARTVDRELNTLSGTIHDALESILEQPEVINFPKGNLRRQVATNLLPGLCIVGGECFPTKADSKIGELTQQQGYCIRLLNLNGRTTATLGTKRHTFPDEIPTMHWKTITDSHGERYHIHTLRLKTIDNRDWGYLQVAQSFHRLDEYMNSLHLILLFGIPLAMLLIGGMSWWLSGLAMQPIYRSYQQIQQFTADAAHELRTPLSVMRIAVDNALELENIESEIHNNLEIASRQIHHLSHLAEDLLWLSRLEAKQSPLQQQPCCLNDLVSDLEEELASLAIANSIDLRLEILTKHQLYIIGDNDRLYRAIANLIHNAIQYTPANGIVTIVLKHSDRTAIVTIQDNGIGIAPADLPHIFDRFYRIQSDRSRTTGGTGLGLAIARAIVIAHHGKIQVQSQLNLGSKFTVNLPLLREPPVLQTKH
jgi:signal transduction histidine kinase